MMSWNLVFSDDFSDVMAFANNWDWVTTSYSGELQQYKTGLGSMAPNNAVLGPDGLIITARKEPDNSYTSAAILSKASYQTCRIEVMASSTAGAGIWPAIWLPAPANVYNTLNQIGEIDLMEIKGQTPASVYTNVWKGDGAGDKTQHSLTAAVDGQPTTNNVYTAEITTEKVDLFVNGVLINSLPRLVADTPSWQLKINLAIGDNGSWVGLIDDSALPAQLKIKYVKIWEGTGFVDRPGTAAFKGNPNQLLH